MKLLILSKARGKKILLSLLLLCIRPYSNGVISQLGAHSAFDSMLTLNSSDHSLRLQLEKTPRENF